MSVTLFVWDAMTGDSKVGHASASVGSPSTYISWWPEATGILAPSSPAMKMARISTDKRLEARPPDFASAPINGLDEKAIIKCWNGLKGTKIDYGLGGIQKAPTITPPKGGTDQYNLYLNNCSTVVFKCLVAGGLFKTFPKVKFLFGEIITPADIRKLANVVTDYAGGEKRTFSFEDHFLSMVASKF